MILTLILTPEANGAARLQDVLDDRREALARLGVHYAQSPGRKNHTRLLLAALDPDHVDPLRFARGYADPGRQALLADILRQELAAEAARAAAPHLVLSASQLLTTLVTEAELRRLHALLAPLADEIRLVLHVDEPARTLVRVHAEQVWDGRSEGLDQELALAAAPDWHAAALAARQPVETKLNRFPELHAPPFWLDLAATRARWQAVFGTPVVLRPAAPALAGGKAAQDEVAALFGLAALPGRVPEPVRADPPSAEWLARSRQLNALFERLLATGRILPRPLWRKCLAELAVPGAPVAPGSLAAISQRFAADSAQLAAGDPALAAALVPDPPQPWIDPEPGNGFRATQYLTAFLPRIDKATQEARRTAKVAVKPRATGPAVLSPQAEALLPPLAKATFATLAGGRFAPHNRLGQVNEAAPAEPYPEVPRRALPPGRSGNVIVGCMKNEAPYIVEWVAYHRAIGVDQLLIYTNGCEDGTDEILDRLQALGAVQHRLNDDWKGNSPQQAALNKALKEPVVQGADWLIHIDVDEFINVRTGDGTLAALFAAVPEATNFAMTWRLFGHSGIQRFEDRPVIGQFTRCAPAWCPKPHTAWGFKSMFRNTGAYAKFSCHRPNKLDPARRDEVVWVNGSGKPMADSLKDKGWRSGTDDIGYDLVQLNHYALRSADSFLIKRQRGRALHVDRSIGLNYWIRMDWDDATDLTIQRNLPRLRAEMDRLLADPELARLHRAGVDWHRAKAAELHATPEFQDRFAQAVGTRLSGLERVAYALALDVES